LWTVSDWGKLTGGTDYSKILKGELDRAGVGLTRIHIDTFGNETSLNSYGHCQHVFLVGILHRDVTELVGQYLGQIRDITGEITKELADDIHLSERAHLAYQALSRGRCRFVDHGQARGMKGYIVEIDPEIETSLSNVMPGVKWSTWKPVSLPETDSLVETWTETVRGFLLSYDGVKIGSKTLKRSVHAEKLTESTWRRVVKASLFSHPAMSLKKELTRDDGVESRLVGQSLVRVSAEFYGFQVESVA
jgi:hypothetical protein